MTVRGDSWIKGDNWAREPYCFAKQDTNEIKEIKIHDKTSEFQLSFIFIEDRDRVSEELYLVTKRDSTKPRAFKDLHRLNNYLREHFKGVKKSLIY